MTSGFFVYPKDRPVDAKGRKVIKIFDYIWYSMMAAIFSALHKFVWPLLNGDYMFWLGLLLKSTCNRSTCFVLSTSFICTYEQRNLKFPTRYDHWLFQDGCQIVGNNNAGFTVHIDSGFADNKYFFNPVLLWMFNSLL